MWAKSKRKFKYFALNDLKCSRPRSHYAENVYGRDVWNYKKSYGFYYFRLCFALNFIEFSIISQVLNKKTTKTTKNLCWPLQMLRRQNRWNCNTFKTWYTSLKMIRTKLKRFKFKTCRVFYPLGSLSTVKLVSDPLLPVVHKQFKTTYTISSEIKVVTPPSLLQSFSINLRYL